MTTIKNLLLTGIIGLTIASCAKDPVEYNVVGNALPIVIAEHAQSFIDMKALEAELDSVYNVLAQRNAEIVDLKLDIENYKVLVGEQAAEIEVLTLLVADLEAKIADQEAQIILLQDTNIELEDANNALAAANDELSQMNGHLQSDIDNKQKEIDALRAHIETLVASIGSLTETINLRDTEIVTLEGDIKTITEVVDNSVIEVTDLLTHDFSINEFVYAGTKWTETDSYSNEYTLFRIFTSQANGRITVKFGGFGNTIPSELIGHASIGVDYSQVRQDQAGNFKTFTGTDVLIDEMTIGHFATDYIAEIVVDDTLENTSVADIAAGVFDRSITTIVIAGIELNLNADNKYAADGISITFAEFSGTYYSFVDLGEGPVRAQDTDATNVVQAAIDTITNR